MYFGIVKAGSNETIHDMKKHCREKDNIKWPWSEELPTTRFTMFAPEQKRSLRPQKPYINCIQWMAYIL